MRETIRGQSMESGIREDHFQTAGRRRIPLKHPGKIVSQGSKHRFLDTLYEADRVRRHGFLSAHHSLALPAFDLEIDARHLDAHRLRQRVLHSRQVRAETWRFRIDHRIKIDQPSALPDDKRYDLLQELQTCDVLVPMI